MGQTSQGREQSHYERVSESNSYQRLQGYECGEFANQLFELGQVPHRQEADRTVDRQTDRLAGALSGQDHWGFTRGLWEPRRRDITATGISEEVSAGEEPRALSSRPSQSTLP